MIGIFDSGVGGLSIYREVKKVLPYAPIIYLADQKNAPYGSKSEENIKTLTIKALHFLKNKGVKMIIIACNTSTVSGIEHYRNSIPVPLVGLVPAIKPAAKENKKIAVLSTKATSQSKKLKEYIDSFSNNKKVYLLGNNKLVTYIEKNDFISPGFTSEMDSVIHTLETLSVDALVLGCTHFVFLKKYFKEKLPLIDLFDSGKAVSKHIKTILKDTFEKKRKTEDQFFTTLDPGLFSHSIHSLLRLKVEVKKVDLV